MGEPLKERVKNCVLGNLFTLLTVTGVIGGIVLGAILRASRPSGWPKREVMYVAFVGDIFLQILRALVLPLIFSSIVSAIGSLDLRLSGKIGARAIAYYFTTTCIAVLLGLIICVTIEPGRGGGVEIEKEVPPRNVTTVDTLLDLLRNMFPPNLIQACIAQYQTVLKYPTQDIKDFEDVAYDLKKPWEKLTEKIRKSDFKIRNATEADWEELLSRNITEGINLTTVAPPVVEKNITLYDWKITHQFAEGTNILGLVVFAVVLGITLSKMGEEGKPLLKVFNCLAAAMIMITSWVIWISPLGVFFLVAAQILEMESFDVVIGQMGMYSLTVLLGLFIHGFIVLPAIFTAVTKTLPFRYVLNLADAITTAFGTASSNATLPVSMRCLEEYNGVDPRVVRFVMPIGATINMDGTALYEAVAALFISQIHSMKLSIGQMLAVSITATAASIGAAGIPQAGQITMVMVLDTIGLPSKEVARIIVVDWLLDRFRTTVNVVGDALGAGIVNHLSKNELKKEVKLVDGVNDRQQISES